MFLIQILKLLLCDRRFETANRITMHEVLNKHVFEITRKSEGPQNIYTKNLKQMFYYY